MEGNPGQSRRLARIGWRGHQFALPGGEQLFVSQHRIGLVAAAAAVEEPYRCAFGVVSLAGARWPVQNRLARAG